MTDRRAAVWPFACLLALLVGCGGPTSAPAPAGGGAPGLKRLIFLTNGDDPFWDACNAGLVEGAKRFGLEGRGLRVVMEKNNGTAQGQIEKLRQFGSQSDIAGVAISVIQADNAAIVEEMKSLAAKGVKVITVDGDVNRGTFRDARPFYIGTDNIVGGRLLGRAARAILAARGRTSGGYVQFAGFTDNRVGGRLLGAAARAILAARRRTAGGYVQFAGFTDNDNARSRMDGFKEAVGTTFTEADRMSDEMDLAKARDNVRTALVNHPDLVALVGIWAYNAPAIAEVVEERGVRDRLAVVTFDAQAAAIERMAAGKIDAMVVQNPFEMGLRTVRLLAAMHAGDEATIAEMYPDRAAPDGDLHTTGLRLIVPDANPLVKPADVGMEGFEYLPLAKFREWLAAYGLSSS